MLDTVRTLLLAAVGAVDITEEKARTLIDDLVRRGELAAEDAKAFASRFAAGGAARRQAAADESVRAAVEEVLGTQNVASHASVLALEARIATLEDVVARLVAAATEQ